MERIHTQPYHSPCGDLLLGSLGDDLCLCNWLDNEATTTRVAHTLQAQLADTPSATTREAARQLDEYFAGERQAFTMPTLFAGTDFQKRVWAELRKIPFGTTISYGQLARRMGCPKAVRAVAKANGANAMSIIVPCHRVVGSNGKLTGYAGGLAAKAYLLRRESQPYAEATFASTRGELNDKERHREPCAARKRNA